MPQPVLTHAVRHATRVVMESQYTDVKFVFDNTEEDDAWALGNAIVRAEGTEMVLELAEDDNQPPFCRVIGKRGDNNVFTGANSIRRKGIPLIEASWTMDGERGSGTWKENGHAYPFSFTLP